MTYNLKKIAANNTSLHFNELLTTTLVRIAISYLLNSRKQKIKGTSLIFLFIFQEYVVNIRGCLLEITVIIFHRRKKLISMLQFLL